VTRKAANTGVEVNMRVTAEQVSGQFDKFKIDIEPYTMQPKSPSTRLATLTQIMQTFIMPFVGMMQQQGMMVNFQSLLQMVSRYTDMSELDDLIIYSGQQPMSAGSGGGTSGGRQQQQGPGGGGQQNTAVQRMMQRFAGAGRAA